MEGQAQGRGGWSRGGWGEAVAGPRVVGLEGTTTLPGRQGTWQCPWSLATRPVGCPTRDPFGTPSPVQRAGVATNPFSGNRTLRLVRAARFAEGKHATKL